MAIEEMECNGEVKQENLSSSDCVITYTRRTRSRRGDKGSSEQNQGFFVKEEVFDLPISQVKGKDFGWEHGDKINGGCKWKCKYCNVVGLSGGVTRLKKHLAGGWHVKSCEKVPKDVAKMMNNHLLGMKKKRFSKSRKREREQDDIDETKPKYPHLDVSVEEGPGQISLNMPVLNGTEQSGRTVKKCEADTQHSWDSHPESNFATHNLNTDKDKVSGASQKSKKTTRRYKTTSRRLRASIRSRIATRRSNSDKAKAMEEPHDRVLHNDTYVQGDLAGTDNHCRNVLRLMLQVLDVCESGGIECSICDAVKFWSPDNNDKSNMADVPTDNAEPKYTPKNHFEALGQSTSADVSGTGGFYDLKDEIANKKKCQDVLFHILCSEKFVLLCNLLCENFQGIKVDKLFDINQLNSKMKNGVYGQSPRLFNQDLQQMWRKLQKIGEEMVLLASSLSKMSHDIHRNPAVEDLAPEACVQKCELNSQIDSVAKNSNISNTLAHFPSCESVPSPKPDQTETSYLYKVCTCKQCGTKTDAERSLICDECEAVYHFSCVEPAVQEIPTRSWYCASCTKETTTQSCQPPPIKNNTQEEGLHGDTCVVCDRLEISETKENLIEAVVANNGSRESSVSSMESDEPLEPSRTALSRLCKQCGTCEDDDRRFLVCGHSQCPYKYYHVRCLKTSQIASFQQKNQECWYCPSCLCRGCFRDRDDQLIVLCDGCDEAYHTYCMKPPRNSVPKGAWYCLQCNVAKAKEGMRRYEQLVLQQHLKKDVGQPNRSMDVLLSAVDKLSSEGKLAAGRKEE